MASPPSFDSFFSSQQRDGGMRSHQSSFDYPSQAYVQTGTEQFGAIYAQQLGDEPQSLGGEETLTNTLHHRPSQDMLRPNYALNDPRADVERKDSVPFDPTSSSTLIASASPAKVAMQQHHMQQQQQQQMPQHPHQQQQYQFSSAPSSAGMQYGGFQQQQQQQSPQPPQQQHMMSPPLQGMSPQPEMPAQPQSYNNFLSQNQGFYSEQNVLPSTSPAPQNNEWVATNDYLGQNGAGNGSSRPQSWNGSAQLGGGYDTQLDELQRIISNASSHAGSPAPEGSRVASPFQQQQQPQHRNQNMGHGHARHDSASSIARSPSPFTANTPSMAAPSPPISTALHRASTTSLQNSPSFSKPQSPPALIIPNSSPSPSFQSISTAANQAAANAAAPGPSHQSTHQGQQGSQFGNSLLPPTNPALEHLTGMAGISPIAPNADGPMITIQPSTPISGMKEHAGVFDDALRRANAQQQQQNQQQSQQSQQQQNQQTQQQVSQQQSNGASPSMAMQQGTQDNSVFVGDNQWNDFSLGVSQGQPRERSKSESYMTDGARFDRQAAVQLMQGPMAQYAGEFQQTDAMSSGQPTGQSDPWSDINTWRMNQALESGQMTLDPRQLPGSDGQQNQLQEQLRSIEAQQRARLQQINTESAVGPGGVFKYEPGQFSPTSAAFYAQLGQPQQPQPGLLPPGGGSSGMGARRRSFAEGTHPAAGAGTPGYGVEFTMPGAITPPGRIRGGSFNMGHRRAVRSEDYGRPQQMGGAPGTGWGVGAGGSTSDFLQAITNPSDGTLLPPSMRGRSMSHSRHSSASSVRSPSPALSISSQGSSFSHHSHMDMPDGVPPELFHGQSSDSYKVAKMKVTSMATEVASQSRRTNEGVFKCPIPGCKSTFTRHFNLKGHLRSHNDERPYKCLYDGCPKAIVGFARQHDCKRHMLLHEGLRPFECEGCGKKFARLDALTRHHKSEQGQECAISHPLPTNPDGSAMSESQYKAYRLQQMKERGGNSGAGSSKGGRRSGGISAEVSGDERDVMPVMM